MQISIKNVILLVSASLNWHIRTGSTFIRPFLDVNMGNNI
jgi:hypothetical protein